MTIRDDLTNDYFEWLVDLVRGVSPYRENSYRKLLMHLHDIEFTFSIPRDENRAEDGVCLRRRFSERYSDYITGPCSVLEMMVALAIRCEESIMDDPNIGDRTSQWFWGMIANLGLNAMNDVRYDRRAVNDAIETFLNRKYEPDGRGGLFRIRNCDYDLRVVEIWYQLCWYLDSITC